MKLTDEQKAWIVVAFACYQRNWEVCRDFEVEFGSKIDKRQVGGYSCVGIKDEKEAKAKKLGKWWPLHKKARERFDNDVMDVPIAQKSYRLRKLDEMFEEAYRKRNIGFASKLLEQAAKETGGLFSSHRTVNAKVDGKVEIEHDLPPELRDTLLAERLRAAMRIAVEQGPQASSTIQ